MRMAKRQVLPSVLYLEWSSNDLNQISRIDKPSIWWFEFEFQQSTPSHHSYFEFEFDIEREHRYRASNWRRKSMAIEDFSQNSDIAFFDLSCIRYLFSEERYGNVLSYGVHCLEFINFNLKIYFNLKNQKSMNILLHYTRYKKFSTV